MVGLWAHDRETVWAFNSIRYRAGFPRVGYKWTTHNRLICVAQPNQPYGVSTHHTPRQVTHLTDRVLIGWRRGKFMGAQMRWLCGARTEQFRLEPDPSRPLCVICGVRAGRVGYTATIHIGQVIING